MHAAVRFFEVLAGMLVSVYAAVCTAAALWGRTAHAEAAYGVVGRWTRGVCEGTVVVMVLARVRAARWATRWLVESLGGGLVHPHAQWC